MMEGLVPLSHLAGKSGLIIDGDWVESKDQNPEGDVRLVQLADIGVGSFLDKSSRFMTSEKAEKLKCTFLHEGDILVARMPDPLGRACQFPGDTLKCVTVVDVCVIRPDSSIAYPPYITHLLNSDGIKKQLNRFIKGTTRQRISRTNLERIQIPLPPLPEQRRIAAILDKADALRAKRREALAQLDELTQSIFIEMFGDPVANPKGWPTMRFGDYLKDAEVFVDGDWVESKDQDPDGEVRLIQLADIGDGRYINKSARFLNKATATRLKCTPLKEGDILIARMPDPLGRACIFPGDMKESVTVVDVCIVRPASLGPNPTWLMNCINTHAFRNLIAGEATGTTRTRISRGNLAKLKIIAPPQQLQMEFTDRYEAIQQLQKNLLKGTDRLSSLFTSLQHRAFRGEL
jgi:type I restriction enzyme S subunit